MKKKDNMPNFVYLGLWGINSRRTAWGFVWFSVALAVVSLIYGFVHPEAFVWVMFLGAAWWYLCSIKWVDNNSTWKKE